MTPPIRFLSPLETARRLGVSVKALRVYEDKGLVEPVRTQAGWRAYGPEQMARLHQILALKRLGLPLKMAAKVDAADSAYFHEVIAPLLDDPLIEFIGEIGDDQKSEFLGGAEALLFPIDWPEPFGLVMIEAMACGTPVVAWRCGSTSEVIEPGVTGFLVDSDEEADRAVMAARKLNRADVRRRFDLRFSAGAMARRYVDLYERIGAPRTNLSPVANQVDAVLARTA